MRGPSTLPCPTHPGTRPLEATPEPRPAPKHTTQPSALPRHIRRQRMTPTGHYEVQNKTQTMSFCPDRRRPHSPKVHDLLSARNCLPGYWNLVYPQRLPRTHGAEMLCVRPTATNDCVHVKEILVNFLLLLNYIITEKK